MFRRIWLFLSLKSRWQFVLLILIVLLILVPSDSAWRGLFPIVWHSSLYWTKPLLGKMNFRLIFVPQHANDRSVDGARNWRPFETNAFIHHGTTHLSSSATKNLWTIGNGDSFFQSPNLHHDEILPVLLPDALHFGSIGPRIQLGRTPQARRMEQSRELLSSSLRSLLQRWRQLHLSSLFEPKLQVPRPSAIRPTLVVQVCQRLVLQGRVPVLRWWWYISRFAHGLTVNKGTVVNHFRDFIYMRSLFGMCQSRM